MMIVCAEMVVLAEIMGCRSVIVIYSNNGIVVLLALALFERGCVTD